ncbi:hypothetical protein [Vibrio rhizosphaerae]|uniref:hypothetical protein n=1 Tax=Vibrio rhizosphaerae TaxID=398736 RepID=UPI00056E8A4C|nr:hypothetical protein [Vibrio rhizosphaerae]
MYEIILRGIGIYALVWMIVIFICSLRYSFGDREHIQVLVRKLAKNPRWYLEDRGFLVISGMSAAGIFFMYTMIYPLIVHRSIKRGYKMDLMMWLHWLWWVCFLFPWSYVV